MCSVESRLQNDGESEPSPRGRHFAACVGNELYLWGGESCFHEDEINFSVVESFKLREEVWTSVPTVRPCSPRGDGACTAANHSFFILGGDLMPPFPGAGGLTESLFEYDTKTSIWKKLSDAGPAVYGSRMVHDRRTNCIVHFGGCSYGAEYNNDLDLFDLKKRKFL